MVYSDVVLRTLRDPSGRYVRENNNRPQEKGEDGVERIKKHRQRWSRLFGSKSYLVLSGLPFRLSKKIHTLSRFVFDMCLLFEKDSRKENDERSSFSIERN